MANATTAPFAIEMTCVEGCSEPLPTFSTYSKADTWLRQRARTAPAGSAYDKHWFRIRVDGVVIYSGRLDLTRAHVASDAILVPHIRRFVATMVKQKRATDAERAELFQRLRIEL